MSDIFFLSYAQSAHLIQPPGGGKARRLEALTYSPPQDVTVQGPTGPVTVTPIQGADLEVQALAAWFSASRVLRGPRATPRAYLRAARNCDILHIAAHALVDTRSPYLSSFVLAPAIKSARVDMLTGGQIARSRITAQLVVLAACDTGRGRSIGSEGTLGLARAHLEAGARSALVSLWSVDDDATSAFMRVFYAALSGGGGRAEALAQARRALQRSARFAHPFYWSPFVLIDHAPAALGIKGRPPRPPPR